MIGIYKGIVSMLVVLMLIISAYSIGRSRDTKGTNAGLIVMLIYMMSLIAIWV